MNIPILLFLCSLNISKAPAISPSPDTAGARIYIIGVFHFGNQLQKVDSLLAILNDVKPDLILSETDTLSGYFTKDYQLVQPPGWYKLANKRRLARKLYPEDEVLYAYREQDPNVSIHPFDIPIPNRNKYVKKMVNNEQAFIDKLKKAHRKGKIPAALDSAYKTYISLMDFYRNNIDKGYRQLNQKEMVDSSRTIVHLEKDFSRTFVDNIPEMARYKDWQSQYYKEWELRNETMAQNIERFIHKTQAKRVVILTGMLHKYYLTDLLGQGEAGNKYELVEYFK